MRKVREVLRLKHTLGMSLRQISEATGVGKTVVGEYVRRAGVIGISWPVPEAIDDAELERRLFPVPCETGPPRAAIDWRKIHEEMKRRSVTLVLLWEEYRAEQAAGYGYTDHLDAGDTQHPSGAATDAGRFWRSIALALTLEQVDVAAFARLRVV